MDVLLKYATSLRDQDSDLMLVSANENMHEQLAVAGVAGVVGDENIYTSDEWVGKTIKGAYQDAVARVDANAEPEGAPPPPDPGVEPEGPEAQDEDL
jgi:SulP family sulfate permease